MQRVFHPVAVHFKGKGFYNTDYGTKRRARELEGSAEKGADRTESSSWSSSSSDSLSSGFGLGLGRLGEVEDEGLRLREDHGLGLLVAGQGREEDCSGR